MSKRTCECGAKISALGMAAHLRGNDHRCRMTCRAAEATGRVQLPGANGSTATALALRDIDHVRASSWAKGGIHTPGYESTLVYVYPSQIASIACWSGAVAAALLAQWEAAQARLTPAARAAREDNAMSF